MSTTRFSLWWVCTRTLPALKLLSSIDNLTRQNLFTTSIFIQSHVRAQSELIWFLSCVTPISWLNKIIQFKEKSRESREDVGTVLLTYPLLMASDILLYQCDLVPKEKINGNIWRSFEM